MPGTDTTTLPVFSQSRARSAQQDPALLGLTHSHRKQAGHSEPLLLRPREPAAGFLHGVLRGCLVQTAASPPTASCYPPATAGTTEAQHGEWALGARSLPCPDTRTGMGVLPPISTSLHAGPLRHPRGCRVRGLHGMAVGRAGPPPPAGSSPPAPSLLGFLGTSGTLARWIYISLLITLYLIDSHSQLKLASAKSRTESFCKVHACTCPSVQQPSFSPTPRSHESCRAANPFS